MVVGIDEFSSMYSTTPTRSLRYDSPTTIHNLTRATESVPGKPVLRDYLVDRVQYVDGSNATVDLEAGYAQCDHLLLR